jgi:RimJ/RimL family protein N-acetyltransferase
MDDLFRGKLVRLTMEEPEFRSRQEVHWQFDSEFQRLARGTPSELFSAKKLKDWFEKAAEAGFKPETYRFSIRALADEKLIGFLSLWRDLVHADVWVGIGIGDRAYWSRGCGTEAMQLAVQYAFRELGVQRVSLALYAYNPRALRAYEKAGFRVEGRTRRDVLREGQYYDSIWMGILREEWLQRQGAEQ